MLPADERHVVHPLISAAVIQVRRGKVVAHSDVSGYPQNRESFFILPQRPAVRPIPVYSHSVDAERFDREIGICVNSELRNVLEIESKPEFVDQRRTERMHVLRAE